MVASDGFRRLDGGSRESYREAAIGLLSAQISHEAAFIAISKGVTQVAISVLTPIAPTKTGASLRVVFIAPFVASAVETKSLAVLGSKSVTARTEAETETSRRGRIWLDRLRLKHGQTSIVQATLLEETSSRRFVPTVARLRPTTLCGRGSTEMYGVAAVVAPIGLYGTTAQGRSFREGLALLFTIFHLFGSIFWKGPSR